MNHATGHHLVFKLAFALSLCWACADCCGAEATTNAVLSTNSLTPPRPAVVEGILQPRRPVAEALEDAMRFLKKADGAYVPGRIDGPLAGYFTSAHVNPDGSRSDRKLSFPARQHAYFIFTFLHYYAYTGEPSWLLRARDLADWNVAHSTPPQATYANLPYSTMSDGKPGGSRDQDAIEPDKDAFLGSAYLAVYEVTAEKRYLEAAQAVAQTLARQQRQDGSWPFRVLAEDGKVQQDFGGAPVFFVAFFEKLLHYADQPAYRQAHQRALQLMLQRNVEHNQWGTYHEDIVSKPESYLSAEPMSFTADYLFRRGREHPEYLEQGRQVIRRLEARLVYTEGHAAAPAPAVSEQAGFDHVMPGHTARYCLALADLYALTGDDQVRRRALSGVNALTYMQSPPGLFRTFFYSANPKANTAKRSDWYSQHLYTVCHVLELMPVLPELAPNGQSHVLGSDVFLSQVSYAPGSVKFKTVAPSCTCLKLNFVPQTVLAATGQLTHLQAATDQREGWSFNPAAHLLIIRHPAGQVEALDSTR